jgi:starch synthase
VKVLIAASEVAPIIKLGGLGDVIGSLPKALEELGVDADVIVPFYPVAKTADLKIYKSQEIDVPFNNATHVVEVHKTKLPGSTVDVFLLKNIMFKAGGQSAFAGDISETEMFAFFNRAIVEFIKAGFNTYDLVHCNDWHTGMVTHLLADEIDLSRPATLLTVHNLSYQGWGDTALVEELGIIPGDHPLIDWDISDGDINFLLQGITSSDFISTVSQSYAKEVLYKDIGGDLSEILYDRQGRLMGILNGIDYSAFPRDFDNSNWKSKKLTLKKKLLEKMKLENDIKKPVFSFVSRLDPNQKGLDILLDVIPHIVKEGGQFILLGTGDPIWEDKFKKLTEDKDLKDNISINIEFDVDIALSMYAGSDFKLIPSRFEPCGLTQMISMWYGTLPIAHATGGLRDSIKTDENGFLFNVYDTKDFKKAIDKAFKIFGTDKYDSMVGNALKEDFSWAKSAKKYMELYEKVIQIRNHHMEISEVEGEDGK